MNMSFDTEITLAGPWRSPRQMLGDQQYDGHSSIHDPDTAAAMGLTGAPIEAPTHFSQFDPLASLVWGAAWFERGCISAHFSTMVVEGEQVQASMTTTGGGTVARIEARKNDGSTVLTGTTSIGPEHGPTELDERRARQAQPDELFIVDRLRLGMRSNEGLVVSMTQDEDNGESYPFSLAQKLVHITEPHPWYTPEGAKSSPWERPIVPMEMISVLAAKSGADFPVRTPSLGLYLDLEIRLYAGPVFVDQEYEIDRTIVGLGASRKTESYWTETRLVDRSTGVHVASVVLHQGVFKASYPGYPAAAQ
jgi:hypothetical protein